MTYLLSQNYFHLDIKPENILLDKNFNIKICDFGQITTERIGTRKDVGTKGYNSPEVYLSQSYEHEAKDLWSMMMVLFIIVYGRPPFEAANFDDNHFKLFHHKNHIFWAFRERNRSFSTDFKDLINKSFNVNTAK